MAQQYVTFAARIAGDNADPETAAAPEALRKMVMQTSRRITDLAEAADPGRTVESVQTRTELAKLRTALQVAVSKLEQADPATNKANMVVMGPAARPAGEAPPTRAQLIVGGALLFFLITVIGHLTAARMSRRLRTEPEIAAALGSALLGTVDVPGEPRARRPKGLGPRARIRRLLGVDTRWDTPPPQTSGDEAGRKIRYRRCAPASGTSCPPRKAAGRRSGRRRDRPPGRRAPGHRGSERSFPRSSSRGYPTLRVVGVSVSQPLIPDRDEESGALVVLSAGNWTAAELAGIAEACADAGHEVVGIVVAGPVRGRPAPSADDSPDAATAAVPVGVDARGGTA